MRSLPLRMLALAGLAFAPVSISHLQMKGPFDLLPTTVRVLDQPRVDRRLFALRRFFERIACPVREYSELFIDVADLYHLDWRLLPSLSYVESGCGKAVHNNNLFGWDSGRAVYESPASSIRQVGYCLAHSRLYRWKDVDALLAAYNGDPDYAFAVKSIMQRIAPAR